MEKNTGSDGSSSPSSKSTLGLTGLTSNAMALIAPGAFLWLTFQIQSLYGAPMAGCAMWFGIVAALLLCFATAISYAELSKLFPGAGSSYLYAEQAFLGQGLLVFLGCVEHHLDHAVHMPVGGRQCTDIQSEAAGEGGAYLVDI